MPQFTKAEITAAQPKIPEPWLPESYIDPDNHRPDWHADVLDELAKQLGVMNDFFYPLIGAASKLRGKSE